MKEVRIFVFIVAIALLAGALVVYIYLRINPHTLPLLESGVNPTDPQAIYQYMKTNDSGLPLPDQLTTQFDPTQSPVVLRVTAIDKASGSIQVVGMSPASWGGRTFSTKIACPAWDLRFTKLGSNNSEYVVPGQLLNMIGSVDSQDVIVSGMCSDTDCAEMRVACRVSVFAKGKP